MTVSRKFLAHVGLVIAVTSTGVLISGPVLSPAPQVLYLKQSGDRTQSQTSRMLAPGFHGPIMEARWTQETWSWKAPEKITEGESAQLSLKCHITNFARTISGPAGEGIDEYSNEAPSLIKQPHAVTVEGPFWPSPVTQTTPSNHPNPLEWSWVVTAKSAGINQIIQITLPVIGRLNEVPTERILFKAGQVNSSSSRFIIIPVEVIKAGVIGTYFEKIIALAGWLLGGGLAGPYVIEWIRKLIKEMRRRRIGKPRKHQH